MLFRYRLELAKANVLGRSIQFLRQVEKKFKPQKLPFELKSIQMSYGRIKNDLKDDYDLIRDTLDMANTPAHRASLTF